MVAAEICLSAQARVTVSIAAQAVGDKNQFDARIDCRRSAFRGAEVRLHRLHLHTVTDNQPVKSELFF